MLLDAADAYDIRSERENRLTEILAEVLRASPRLVRWLAGHAFCAAEDAIDIRTHEDYSIATQVRLPDGSRPDLRIVFTPNTKAPGDLYCENKIDAPWTAWQLQGYGADRSNVVIAISPNGRKPHSSWRGVKWREVAHAVDKIGQGWASDQWREEALKPSAPSEYRLLAELNAYLEKEDVSVSELGALSHDDLTLVPAAAGIFARWDELFRLVATSLDFSDLRSWDPDERKAKRETGWIAVRRRPAWTWPALEVQMQDWPESERWALQEIILDTKISWRHPPERKPGFGVGVTVSTEQGWLPGLRENDALRASLEHAGLDFGRTYRNRRGRVTDTKPLKDVVAAGTTLDEQAEYVKKWAQEVLEKISSTSAVQ